MTFFGRSSYSFAVAAGLLALGTPLLAQRGPAPGMTHLDANVMAMACSPSLVFQRPSPSLLITGGQDSFTHYSYAPGDLMTINAGSENGIDVGQEYFVRRVQAPRGEITSRANPATIKTTGWVKVYAVDKKMSLVTVEHACDTLDVGDYLEPFQLPTVPTPDANPPKAQHENYGHILLGTDCRTVFAKDDFFVVDCGSDHGVTVGARFIIYRDKHKTETLHVERVLPKEITTPEFLFEIGEAVVVSVQPELSTLKTIWSHDAFWMGDYVALRK